MAREANEGAASDSGLTHVARIEDLAILLDPPSSCGRAVLDADRLAVEDIGLVRRFLERQPHWSLLLVGARSSAPAVRAFRSHPSAEFWVWPIDVDELAQLLRPPELATYEIPRVTAAPARARAGRPAGQRSTPPRAPTPAAHARSLSPELREIEAILGTRSEPRTSSGRAARTDVSGSLALARRPAEPEYELDELERFDELEQAALVDSDEDSELEFDLELEDDELEVVFSPEESDADAPLAARSSSSGRELEAFDREALAGAARARTPRAREEAAPPPAKRASWWPEEAPDFYRQQIAELADLAQCIELSHDAFRRDPAAKPRVLETLGRDVRRLVDFARTLRHLVSPLPVGGSRIDTGELVEELLGNLVRSEVPMPRFVFRNEVGLSVHTTRPLLAEALGAVLQLICTCTAGEGNVRVVTRRLESSDQVCVEFRFPKGPLSAGHVPDLAQPYALRRELPELPPNGLAAAVAILRAQGGSLAARLDPGDQEQLMVRITLPCAAPATGVSVRARTAVEAEHDEF